MTFFSDPDTITGGIPQSEPTELARLRIVNQRLLAACKAILPYLERTEEFAYYFQGEIQLLRTAIAATEEEHE